MDTCQRPPINRPTEPGEGEDSASASGGEEASVATAQQAPSSSSSEADAGKEPTVEFVQFALPTGGGRRAGGAGAWREEGESMSLRLRDLHAA